MAFALPSSETTLVDDCVDRHEIPTGFRHFLGTPNPSQRFKAYGIDPLPRRNIRQKFAR